MPRSELEAARDQAEAIAMRAFACWSAGKGESFRDAYRRNASYFARGDFDIPGDERASGMEGPREWLSGLRAGYRDFVELTRRFLSHYPAEVFTGESGDPGARFVVELRALMEKHHPENT